jgi:hypothetical protein
MKGENMFIIDVIKKEDAKGELKLLYSMIERSLRFVPPTLNSLRL